MRGWEPSYSIIGRSISYLRHIKLHPFIIVGALDCKASRPARRPSPRIDGRSRSCSFYPFFPSVPAVPVSDAASCDPGGTNLRVGRVWPWGIRSYSSNSARALTIYRRASAFISSLSSESRSWNSFLRRAPLFSIVVQQGRKQHSNSSFQLD